MTECARVWYIKKMKKLFSAILIFALILALTAGFFACKKEAPKTESTEELAALAVTTVFSEDKADAAEIASALLALLDKAGLEEPEKISLLKELPNDQGCATALQDLKDKSFTLEHAKSYRAGLTAAASSVSPEIAGKLFYAAASSVKTDLPYTSSDCEKLASLLLGQDTAFGTDLVTKLMNGETELVNEKQVNTMMITLVASLRKATGLSASAKSFLYEFAQSKIDELLPEEGLSAETRAALQKSKTTILALAAVLRDGYDEILSFFADYLAAADARLFVGLPYEKREQTVYYGYTYATWEKTLLTKEQFDAREGDFDEYISMEGTLKGFVINGSFTPISDKDAVLADSAYRLYTFAATYSALSTQKKTSLTAVLDSFLTVLKEDQGTVATLLDRELKEEDPAPGASFDEMISSFAALSDFDATDGVSEGERNAAQNAVSTLESYLHGYLPKVF